MSIKPVATPPGESPRFSATPYSIAFETELKKKLSTGNLLPVKHVYKPRSSFLSAFLPFWRKIRSTLVVAAIFTSLWRSSFFLLISTLLATTLVYWDTIHKMLGWLVVPAAGQKCLPNCANSENLEHPLEHIPVERGSFSDMQIERFSIQVGQGTVDAVQIINNKIPAGKAPRWMLCSLGNAQTADQEVTVHNLSQHMQLHKSHGLILSHPGAGSSTLETTKENLKNTYQAALDYLIKKQHAKELILRGFSLGGATQALGLDGFKFPKDIRVVSIKRQTFTSLPNMARVIAHRLSNPLGKVASLIMKFFGWSLRVDKLSYKLPDHIPQLILETGTDDMPKHDGMIPAEQALSLSRLLKGKISRKKATIFRINTGHNHPLSPSIIKRVVSWVETQLQQK